MSVENHLLKLREKHGRIESTLDNERKRPCPSIETISILKHQRLKIKDEICTLEEHKHP